MTVTGVLRCELESGDKWCHSSLLDMLVYETEKAALIWYDMLFGTRYNVP